ncbi:MAG: efflux RND transporter periplasmic adaptor subunit [Burkholderiales bacterium]|nr:efflux RND transporter periplasmic adaptor subunit [Burkholderiales bacterium]
MRISATLRRRLLFAAFGIVLLLAFGWVASKSGPFAPVKVTVTRVVTGVVAPALFGIGTVEARRAYLIGPTVAGRVRRVLVDVGETVQAGQLLAEMDPVDLDARMRSAAAAAERANSGVDTALAQVRDAKSRLELAGGEARRYEDLGRKGYVSPSVVEAKLQQRASAQAQMDAAEGAVASALQDRSRLEAERSAALEQRSNIRLLAPADGVVTARDAEPGSTVVAGQAVLKLMDPGSLWIKLRLDQGRSAGLRVGLPADIRLRSRPGVSIAGKVARVEPASDSVTEERIAQVSFDALPQSLSTGEMAEVTLRLPALRDVLLIPNAALRQRGAGKGVWLHDNGQLRFAPVITGAEGLDGNVQLVEGLKAGDELIIYSERDLKGGDRIKVLASLLGKAR